MDLHIDVETYSSIKLKKSGRYNYFESLDFEILMVAFAFGDDAVRIVDVAKGEPLPDTFTEALRDPSVLKHAHNASFERGAFQAYGFDIPISEWSCSMIHAAYCGLPLSLEKVSEALQLIPKDRSGKALIRYFSKPCKPTKANGRRSRNLYYHDPEKWEQFKRYCIRDVEVERAVVKSLRKYPLPESEKLHYRIDQEINDRGILVDLPFVRKAIRIDRKNADLVQDRMKTLTGVENPNSVKQLKDWLSQQMREEVTSLAKDKIPPLMEKAGKKAKELLELRQKDSKSSTKKYDAMIHCTGSDSRARGLFQFYGANRTGRWAGRLVQLQNLPQNHLSNLRLVRDLVIEGGYGDLSLMYANVADTLSQLVRTAFIAKPGHVLAVADFSAIEARVIAWLAQEDWRLQVFRSHGKIYEASASMMFDTPIDEIHKGSDLRQKGKVAELALGFGGSVGAMSKMGAGDMGLSTPEMKEIVARWRRKSPNIVKLWKNMEECAKAALQQSRKRIKARYQEVYFEYDGRVLTIELPSKRKLYYYEPSFTTNQWGYPAIQYKGIGANRKWEHVETYGGKLSENITQAIARDILALSIQKLWQGGYEIVMHVHDEVVCEIKDKNPEKTLEKICRLMGEPVQWAPGLPNNAEGHTSLFYKKD